jgi:hypothetical protein
VAGHAVNADDAPAAALYHPRYQGGNQLVRGPDVTGEQGIEQLGAQLSGGAEPREPAVVHQHVHRASLSRQLPDLLGAAEVGGHEAGLPACGFDGGHDVGTAAGVAAVHDEGKAVTGQLQRDRPADAGGGTGHERDR